MSKRYFLGEPIQAQIERKYEEVKNSYYTSEDSKYDNIIESTMDEIDTDILLEKAIASGNIKGEYSHNNTKDCIIQFILTNDSVTVDDVILFGVDAAINRDNYRCLDKTDIA